MLRIVNVKKSVNDTYLENVLRSVTKSPMQIPQKPMLIIIHKIFLVVAETQMEIKIKKFIIIRKKNQK